MNNLFLSLLLLIICVGVTNGQWCYYCDNCPYPFNAYGVPTVQSNSGFCLKKSIYSYRGAPASRGVAPPGYCFVSGCSSTYEAGRVVYYCCCRGDRCNTGSLTSKSTITVLLGALALVTIKRYI